MKGAEIALINREREGEQISRALLNDVKEILYVMEMKRAEIYIDKLENLNERLLGRAN